MAESPEVQIVRLQVLMQENEKFAKERHEDNKQILKQILDQARTTNGRIGNLESWRAGQEQTNKSMAQRLNEATADIDSLKTDHNRSSGAKALLAMLWTGAVAILAGLINWGARKLWP